MENKQTLEQKMTQRISQEHKTIAKNKIKHFVEYNKLFIECLELIDKKAIYTPLQKKDSFLRYKFNDYVITVNEDYLTHSIVLYSLECDTELRSFKTGCEINELRQIIAILNT